MDYRSLTDNYPFFSASSINRCSNNNSRDCIQCHHSLPFDTMVLGRISSFEKIFSWILLTQKYNTHCLPVENVSFPTNIVKICRFAHFIEYESNEYCNIANLIIVLRFLHLWIFHFTPLLVPIWVGFLIMVVCLLFLLCLNKNEHLPFFVVLDFCPFKLSNSDIGTIIIIVVLTSVRFFNDFFRISYLYFLFQCGLMICVPICCCIFNMWKKQKYIVRIETR